MKKVTSIFAAVVLVAMLAIPASAAMAQNAGAQTWSSVIYYMNPGGSAGSVTVNFYSGATVFSSSAIGLSSKQSGELMVGSVGSLPNGFQGSAVLSSDVPILATYREFVTGGQEGNYGRPIYNAFTASQAGNVFYLPAAMKKAFGQQQTSRIGVQNVGTSAVNATLDFFAVGSTTPQHTINTVIQPQASYVFNMADIPNGSIPNNFNGALRVTANGPVVAAATEMFYVGSRAYAFEGVATGSNTIFIPTILCNAFAALQTSFFGIQSIGGNANNVTISYYNSAGSLVGSTNIGTIVDGGKVGNTPCGAPGVGNGFVGSAKITSSGAGIVAVVKVLAGPNTNNELNTAYLAPAAGATSLALPFVHWASSPTGGFRSFIAVMNVGNSNATNIVATYYTANGTIATSHTLASPGSPLQPLTKINTSACAAGLVGTSPCNGSGSFVGSVIVTSDQPIVVNSRNQIRNAVTEFGEDYLGMPVP